MASSPQPPAPSAFPGFSQLDPAIYFYEPSKTPQPPTTPNGTTSPAQPPPSPNNTSLPQPSTTTPPPQLILLATWMSAAPSHITKYILAYQRLYPTSPILLIRASPFDISFLPGANRNNARIFAPAVDVIKACCSREKGGGEKGGEEEGGAHQRPQILLHGFSNGGPNQALKLLRAYNESVAAERKGASFPPFALILDSCPGASGFKLILNALWLSLPRGPLPLRWAMVVVLYLSVAIISILITLFNAPDPIELVKKAFVDREGEMQGEVRRCYVWSEEDEMVPWQAVVRHADEAEARGFVVRRERFVGSAHCAHVRVDGGRYWGVVRGVWEGEGFGEDAEG